MWANIAMMHRNSDHSRMSNGSRASMSSVSSSSSNSSSGTFCGDSSFSTLASSQTPPRSMLSLKPAATGPECAKTLLVDRRNKLVDYSLTKGQLTAPLRRTRDPLPTPSLHDQLPAARLAPLGLPKNPKGMLLSLHNPRRSSDSASLVSARTSATAPAAAAIPPSRRSMEKQHLLTTLERALSRIEPMEDLNLKADGPNEDEEESRTRIQFKLRKRNRSDSTDSASGTKATAVVHKRTSISRESRREELKELLQSQASNRSLNQGSLCGSFRSVLTVRTNQNKKNKKKKRPSQMKKRHSETSGNRSRTQQLGVEEQVQLNAMFRKGMSSLSNPEVAEGEERRRLGGRPGVQKTKSGRRSSILAATASAVLSADRIHGDDLSHCKTYINEYMKEAPSASTASRRRPSLSQQHDSFRSQASSGKSGGGSSFANTAQSEIAALKAMAGAVAVRRRTSDGRKMPPPVRTSAGGATAA